MCTVISVQSSSAILLLFFLLLLNWTISTDNADILFFSATNTQKLLACTYRAVFLAFFFTTYAHDIVLRDMTAHTPTWLACRLSICLFPVFMLLAFCRMRKKQHVSGRPNIYHLLRFSISIIYSLPSLFIECFHCSCQTFNQHTAVQFYRQLYCVCLIEFIF